MRARLILAGLALMAATPGIAGSRDLAVPASAGWQHAASGVILPRSIAGMSRITLIDNGDNELDVAAAFHVPDDSTILTVYIFKPAIMSVPIWFDRSQTALTVRETFGGVTPVVSDAVPFTRPGSTVASGLRQIYAPGKGPYRSTGLAMMPLGDWLVAVRLSSTTFDTGLLDDKLNQVVAAIRFPNGAPAGEAAIPVRACDKPLDYKKAKILKADGAQALIAAMLPMVARAEASEHPEKVTTQEDGPWCRDGAGVANYGVYHHDDGMKSFVLALGDSGRVATVSPGMPLGNDNPGYGVTFLDLDGTATVFASFDRVPRPEQVLEMVTRGHPISRSSSDGKQSAITLSK
jgi:hypothetical protein